ncbi:hypothetical protein [Cytobacillus horneckiae]|uniref:hypothetical protein n=1 Tax=Cytobacillus horneckiae TaxID=549687 RepID=UPI003D9A5EBC
MSNDKYEKINYEIYPLKTMNTSLGLIASIITIYLLIFLFNGFWLTISIMILIIILLSIFLIKFFLRLRTIKNSYNEIVTEVNQASDNRETLANIVNEKNKELDSLRYEIQVANFKLKFLLELWYSENKLPNRKIVETAFQINEKGIEDHEESRI